MKTSNDFINAFSDLNAKIVKAIAEGDFSRVIILDKGRQDMMKDLCLLEIDQVDNQLFDFIEECSRQNTSMIKDMEVKLESLMLRNNRFNKALKAYHC